MNLNKAELIGNLVGDPAAKKLPSGQSLVRFRLATNSDWKSAKSKEAQQRAEYHELIAFGKLADVAAKYLKKGDKVYVDGRLTTNSWQGKDGAKHSRTEIVLQNLIMLGSGKKAEEEKTNDDVIVEGIPMYQNPPADFHD
jgi:single-strand DNA-binding protein